MLISETGTVIFGQSIEKANNYLPVDVRVIISPSCVSPVSRGFNATIFIAAWSLQLFFDPFDTVRMRDIIIIASLKMTFHNGLYLTCSTAPFLVIYKFCFCREIGTISTMTIYGLLFDTKKLVWIIFNWVTWSVTEKSFIFEIRYLDFLSYSIWTNDP